MTEHSLMTESEAWTEVARTEAGWSQRTDLYSRARRLYDAGRIARETLLAMRARIAHWRHDYVLLARQFAEESR